MLSSCRPLSFIKYDCVYLALNEFTDDFVVEVVDRGPFDPLLHILLLLCLQCQLNEDLLKLLIHKVDAELLKSIFLNENKGKITYIQRPYVLTLYFSS